jgi:hypothetical protein
MDKHIIVGIHITDRVHHAAKVQEILTQFGCLIKTRIGLHETGTDCCSPNGLLILELLDKDAEVASFIGAMNAVEGIEVKQMIFDHP